VSFPPDVEQLLHLASKLPSGKTAAAVPQFKCSVFNSPWDQFVELWAPRVFTFVGNALGPYQKQPLPEILKMHDGQHSAGATASFDPMTGQVRLAGSVEGKPGQTLEKLCHEFTHGSLANFPEGDPFYEESFVDYSVWVMAHAPAWAPYSDAMVEAAEFNISMRRDRALKTDSDYDRKRWAGGVYVSFAYGPHIIARLRQRKQEGNLTW
jgi:hypothetical protein